VRNSIRLVQWKLAASVGFAILLSWVVLVGCLAQPPSSKPKASKNKAENGGRSSTDASGSRSVADSAVAAGKKTGAAEPLLKDWKTPAAAILLTGEQHGYFEPCGCSLHQLGGMARRGDLVRILSEERKWPVTGLDVGGTIKRSRRQDQIKFLLVYDALKRMNYKGVALGLEELKLGADFLLQQQVVDPDEAAKLPALLSANVVLFDQPDLGFPPADRIVSVGKVKIGVTAVIGASLRNQVAPEGAASNITIRDPAEVLPGVIKKLEAEKPDFLVLLSHGSEEEAKALAGAFPQFRIILTAGGPEEADPKPVVVGKTWILQAGHKGKRVGVLGYFPDDARQPFRYELVELDDERFKNDPPMRDLMRSYQQGLQDEGIDTSDDLMLKHPSGNKFVGAAKCGECHVKAYEHWKKTKHADGFESLKVGHPGQEKEWIVRIHDPECLSCHVTGWEPQQMLRYDSGFVSEQKTPHLLGQQCENCHGPGSKHVSLEERFAEDAASVKKDELTAGRNAVHRTVEAARNGDCAQCHDPDNSPKFKPDAFDEFWNQIKHPWKD
jgi:Cytochrome c554 and c-prime